MEEEEFVHVGKQARVGNERIIAAASCTVHLHFGCPTWLNRSLVWRVERRPQVPARSAGQIACRSAGPEWKHHGYPSTRHLCVSSTGL